MTTRTTVKPGPIADALKKYGPIVDQESAQSHADGALTPIAQKAFLDGNFAGINVPESMGGYGDFSYAEWFRVVEELSRYDGGAGWCLQAISGYVGMYAAMMSDEGAAELFANGMPRIAGMAAPRGKAIRAEGGWVVEGKHQFASGSTLATHFIAGNIVYENDKPVMLDNGAPEIIGAIIPRANITETGNWNVIGLRATASIDYEVGPIFVPDKMVVHMNPWADSVYRGAKHHRIGFATRAIAGHTPVALGVAQRSLEEIARLAPKRQRQDGSYPAVGSQPHFLHELASVEANLHAARISYLDFLEEVDDYSDNQTGPVSPEWGARSQQLGRYAHDAAIRACDFAYEWSGSSGLRVGNVIGRNFLNIHAINQHIIADRYTFIDSAPTVMAELSEAVSGLRAG